MYALENAYFNKGKIMKLIASLITGLFAVTAFAAEPAKKEEAKKPADKVEAKAPAAPAAKPADKKAEPAKSEAKPAAKAEDKKAEAAKK